MENNTLLIPDIHGRTFWKEAVKDWEGKIVFFGDYLDPYEYQEDISPEDAFINFLDILEFKRKNKDRVILLLGNHDTHYIWKEAEISSRYCREKEETIYNTFRCNMELFKVSDFDLVDDEIFLYTHAGLTKEWFTQNNFDLDSIPSDELSDWLNKLSETSEGRAALTVVGRSRGGYAPSGGPMWADYYSDHDPYFANREGGRIKSDVYQVFGHTLAGFDDNFHYQPGENIACIDCRKAYILNKEKKKIELKEKVD